MRASHRGVLVAALLAAAVVPHQADALLHAQCGGAYSRTTSCSFTAVGANLYAYGSTTGSTITVRVTDATGAVRILSCDGQSSCSAVFGPPATGTDSVGPPPGVGPLTCTVITTGSGFYTCQSSL